MHERNYNMNIYKKAVLQCTGAKTAVTAAAIVFGLFFLSKLPESGEDYFSGIIYGTFTLICAVIIAAYGVILAVYFLRLKKIKESFTDFTIEERLEHCKRVIADRHFFMRECLVSFEIPLRIYYDDIEKVRCFYRISFGRYLRRNYYLQINTKDKKVYLITRFVSGPFILRRRYNTETELIFDKIAGFLSKANPDIEISRLSPEHEFFRRLFKKRP